jgi:hypothetical protein
MGFFRKSLDNCPQCNRRWKKNWLATLLYFAILGLMLYIAFVYPDIVRGKMCCPCFNFTVQNISLSLNSSLGIPLAPV